MQYTTKNHFHFHIEKSQPYYEEQPSIVLIPHDGCFNNKKKSKTTAKTKQNNSLFPKRVYYTPGGITSF